METITIPQKMASKGDLVVISRYEYEDLLALKKIREFTPTAAEKRALAQADRNYRKGKTLSLDAFLKKMERTR